MKVTNKTRRTVLTTDLKQTNAVIDRARGNIGRSEPIAFQFTTRFGIHTLGMKFPLDIIVLNNRHEVVALKKTLKPNNIFFWNPKYSIVLELPQHTITKSKTAL